MERDGKTGSNRQLWPVLAGYFIMAFSDLVAPITPRIAASLPAGMQAWASFLPTTVFLWFLLLSVPVAVLMNRIGRRRTALLGDALAALGLLTAYFAGGEGLAGYFAGFGLLGIGCTAIQVSVNPMLAMLAPRDRMSVYLTLGQVFRNTALLLLAPVVTLLVWLAGSWELLLPLYALLTVAGGLWMAFTRFDDPAMNAPSAERVDLKGYLGLMKNGTVALCALSIGAFLMLDVGIGYLSVQLVDSPNLFLCLPHRRFAGRGLDPEPGGRSEISVRVYGGCGPRLRVALFAARGLGRLCGAGAAGIRAGLRLRHLLCGGHACRARAGERGLGAYDPHDLGRGALGAGHRGHRAA